MTFDDLDEWPIKRVFTKAAPEQVPRGLLASVFDLAHTDLKLRNNAKFSEGRPHHRIERREDTTRCTVISERETLAWQERERQRRARQFIPPPPKATKTLSKRFAEIVG